MMLGILLLAGCVTTNLDQRAAYVSIDKKYAPLLGQEYRSLAALMQANQDSARANIFLSKANDADMGRWVYPEEPGLDKNLNKAHDSLTSALMLFMNLENAQWLAKAQVNYDCLALGVGDDGCQRNFDVAMRGLIIPAKAMKTESIFFTNDSSVLSAEAHRKLDIVANDIRMNKAIIVQLNGHSGGGEENLSLALRRAIAIRNVLAQMGVDPSRISVDGEAHSDTILSKQHYEAGTDPKTHRVDIMMKPVFGQEI